MSLPVIVVGSGGHAAVIADALLASDVRVLGFVDTDPARIGAVVCGLPVLGSETVLDSHTPGAALLANGIGGVRSEGLRKPVQERLESRGWEFVTVRHPSAIVSRFATIGPGAQLLAGCIVQAKARVGKGAIVNTAAVVEHDAVVEEGAVIGPHATVCGRVLIGREAAVGAGATILPDVRIGARAVVGAGALVREHVPEAVRVAGVPSRRLP